MSDDANRWRPPSDDPGENQSADYAEEGVTDDPGAYDESLYAPPDAIVRDEEIEAYDVSASGSSRTTPILVIVVIVLLGIALVLFLRACNTAPAATEPVASPTAEVNAAQTPDLQATITPIVVGTIAAGESPLPVPEATLPVITPDLPATGFQTGMKVVVTGTNGEGARFRTGPGTDYITVTILNDGDELQVVGGPEQADGFTWWRLQAADGTIGWTIADVLEPVQG